MIDGCVQQGIMKRARRVPEEEREVEDARGYHRWCEEASNRTYQRMLNKWLQKPMRAGKQQHRTADGNQHNGLKHVNGEQLSTCDGIERCEHHQRNAYYGSDKSKNMIDF